MKGGVGWSNADIFYIFLNTVWRKKKAGEYHKIYNPDLCYESENEPSNKELGEETGIQL
jgi:hypothetical protein